MADNPLLKPTPYPRFDEIRAEHVEPAIESLLTELEVEFGRVEAEAEATWSGLVRPLEAIDDRSDLVWGAVVHLTGVRNSDELRAAHQAAQPKLVEFSTRLGQSRPVYDKLCAIRDGAEWASLDAAQRRIVEAMIRDAKLSGVGLDGKEKERFNSIQLELADLSTRFGNNVLDATKAFSLTLTDAAEVEGLPASALALAAHAARAAGEEGATPDNGPWRITLDAPSLIPFLEHAVRRDLRERVYRAYITRASAGECDNGPLIERILVLRREEAKLLGYANFAELSLASKMAPDVDAVEGLLGELRGASREAATRDLEDLREFAKSQAPEQTGELRHWDIAYWAEKLRVSRYDLSEEALRPYFPLPRVLYGLFEIAASLFGVRVEAADGDVPVWNDDVRFFRIFDADDEAVAEFYLDPYSRPEEKRGGAWMGDCVTRARIVEAGTDRLRIPVAYVVCNQASPVDGKPSLMNFTELRTLFHEFGHALQHMLTKVDYSFATGIRGIEWDAVELPSQFMENWCYHEETLTGLSAHVDTGEPLPKELFDKIIAARNYRAGSNMLRQIYFSTIDLKLHHDWAPESGETVFDVQRRVAETTTVMRPLPEDRFLCSFGHIFAGGYAAGYYSYKWAEVLSADAFSAFEEAGLDAGAARKETGARFRDTVLAQGGARPPMEVFKSFRGREPSTAALLRHQGLEARQRQ
jgi:oligopeptidase A